jgi:hypothetical protein
MYFFAARSGFLGVPIMVTEIPLVAEYVFELAVEYFAKQFDFGHIPFNLSCHPAIQCGLCHVHFCGKVFLAHATTCHFRRQFQVNNFHKTSPFCASYNIMIIARNDILQ